MAGSCSYADLAKSKIAHAPTAPSLSEDIREFGRSARNEDSVEPELVAAVTRTGKFATIHRTIPREGESLPQGYARSSAGFFLLHTEILPVTVDQEVVRQESAIVAYFVGGKQPSQVLNKWLDLIQELVGDDVVLGRDLGRSLF